MLVNGMLNDLTIDFWGCGLRVGTWLISFVRSVFDEPERNFSETKFVQ
jgi:hypothetical protein